MFSEVLVDNRNSSLDELGNHPSWFELFNPGTVSINLTNWAVNITSSSNKQTMFIFPNCTMKAGSYMIVFASKRITIAQTAAPPFHTNFGMSQNEVLTLFDPTGAVISSISWVGAFQLPDVSFGVQLTALTTNLYFLQPTPGTANPTDASLVRSGVCSNPIFGAERDVYTAPQVVTITSMDTQAILRYTTDFSTPSAFNGTLVPVNFSITVSSTTTIRAIACKPNYFCSPVQTHTFLFLASIAMNEMNPVNAASSGLYDVDTGIFLTATVNTPAPFDNSSISSAAISNALAALPIIMLTSDSSNVFGPNGFYDSDMIQGAALEFLYPSQLYDNLLVDCGVQGFGSNHLKRSLNLIFGGSYLNATLNSEVFISNITSANVNLGNDARFTLLAGDWRNFASLLNPNQVVFTMNRLLARMQAYLGMGFVIRGEFHHLFLNHVYVGIYCLVQQVDATFAEDMLGSKDDGTAPWIISPIWGPDVSVAPPMLSNISAFANSTNLSDLKLYYQFGSLLNVSNFCDFLILQFFSGLSTVAWPYSSSISRTDGALPALFLFNDGELAINAAFPSSIPVFDSTTIVSACTIPSSFYNLTANYSGRPWIAQLWLSLRRNQLFSLLFTDRIQALLVAANAPFCDSALIAIWLSLASYLSPAMSAELSRWGSALTSFGNPTYAVSDWQGAVNSVTSILQSSISSCLLQHFKSYGWLSLLPVPFISSSNSTFVVYTELQLDVPAFNSNVTQNISMDASFLIYFTLSSADVLSRNGTLRSTVFAYNSLLGLILAPSDVLNGLVTVTMRSYQQGPGIGLYSALNTALLIVSANATSVPFLYMSTARDVLTADTDATGKLIYSSVITVMISPAPTSPLIVVLNYQNANLSYPSVDVLSFTVYNSQTPIVLTTSGRSVSVSLPTGLSSFSILAYSQSVLQYAQLVSIQADPTKAFKIDSRSIFFLNTTVIMLPPSNGTIAPSPTVPVNKTVVSIPPTSPPVASPSPTLQPQFPVQFSSAISTAPFLSLLLLLFLSFVM